MKIVACLWILLRLENLSAASFGNEDLETSGIEEKDYQNEWVVRIDGGAEVAALLALQSGYQHSGPVLGFEDTYLWRKDDRARQEKRGHPRLGKTLNSRAKVIWVDRQKIIHRQKRDHVSWMDAEAERPLVREKRVRSELNQSESQIISNLPRGRRKRGWYRKNTRSMDDRSGETWMEKVEDARMFNDELWDQEWYLQDTRTSRDLPKLDLNVLPLYRLGITGRGVRVAVLDDGLEYTHDDLRANYDAEISYDVNAGDHDPIPRYESTGINGHGTRCAGEIAMRANNGKCGVGVAFDASIGGIKLLDGVVNDRVEGEALGYRTDLVDIYTASWGPADDGKSLEAPGRLAREALRKGIVQGRKGKGSIYVWASGNGGSKSDDCGCDGYVGSIYTIAVGSASQTGRFPWYGERCPATLATTYSSGAYHDQMIATTDLRNTCTTKHTGTSASAPLAAGILALALQVNNELTWRDVQHLVVWTSEYSPLRENPGWFKNAAGFWFNPRFGFGLMNAFALVTTANNWTSVPDKRECRVEPTHASSADFKYAEVARIIFETNGCAETKDEVRYLEHVQVEINIRYSVRGALNIHLTTPSGTAVPILSPRKLDDSREGFVNWTFMSVASWGEDPRGAWLVRISDTVGPRHNNGTLGKFKLILHGTKSKTPKAEHGPRIYNAEYNRIRKTNNDETIPIDDISNLIELNASEEDYADEERDGRLNTIRQRNWLQYASRV